MGIRTLPDSPPADIERPVRMGRQSNLGTKAACELGFATEFRSSCPVQTILDPYIEEQKQRRRRWVVTSVVLLGCVLAAPAPAQPSPGACAGLDTAGGIRQVNAVRAAGARCGAAGSFAPATSPLAWSPLLEGLARQQVAWLAQAGLLLHAGSEGQTLSQRAQAVGYRFAQVAENLAQGQRDVATVLAAWTASDSHCVNLYDATVTEMALACASGGDGRPMWVLIVGRPL